MTLLASSRPFSAPLSSTRHSHSLSIPSLDGIRAISVLLVVTSHSGFGKIFVPGGLGVTIFFFLSGYLISTLLLAEGERSGRIRILNFYARRVFRLMPPLFVTLAIAYGLVYAGLLPGRFTLEGFAALVLYFANYYFLYFEPGNIPAGMGVLWSLAVEEHFYLFYPLAMTLFLRRSLRPQTIGIVLGILCVIILVWRIYLVKSGAVSAFRPHTYSASDTRIDSIIYGCLLAICMNPTRDLSPCKEMTLRQWAIFGGGVGLLFATLVYRDPAFRETFRYSIQGIALLPIFYFAIRFHDNTIFRHLNSNWIMKLGVYSYSIYLIHDVILTAIQVNLPAFWGIPLVLLAAVLTLSIAYAAAIDSLVDPYFRRLRQRYRPGGCKT